MHQFVSKEFEDYRDADDAVYELNGKELCGERYEKQLISKAFCVFLVFIQLSEGSSLSWQM